MAKDIAPPRMTSSDVRAALRKRYSGSEWALMFEVGKSTGAGTSGWADAVAMNLWPSRGMELHGFEIKVYRGDWLRELKDPSKAEDFVTLVDRWWIVAPAGLVKAGELPPTWGLLEVSAALECRQVIEAPCLHRFDQTGIRIADRALPRAFAAALLRRASEADAGEIGALVETEVSKRREGDAARVKSEIEARTRKANEILEKLEAIRVATGINLNEWAPTEEVAAAVRFALQANLADRYGGAKDIAARARKLADTIDTALAQLAPVPETEAAT